MTTDPTGPDVPPWTAPLFAVLALVTVPWIAYLAVTLPKHIETHHYRGAWVGFDTGLVAMLLLTAYLAWRGNRRVALTATATATLLVTDAWFDVMSAPTRRELAVSVALAVLVELPLAGLCLWMALHVAHLVARRMRQLARRAERAAARGVPAARVGARAVRAGARSAEASARIAEAGSRVADAAAQVAEAGTEVAETAEKESP